jgi:sodium-dependent phosphate transporter
MGMGGMPMGGYPGMPMGMPMGGYPAMGMGFGNGLTVSGGNFGDAVKAAGEGMDEDERPRINGIPMYYTTNDQWYDTLLRKISPGMYIDIDALCDECAELHSHANHFYDKTERLYKTLQISSCFFFSLSHGANDIANAIGPLSAVWAVYTSGEVNSKSNVDPGVLAYGALMLCLGLVLMGHNIMMVLGNKVTYQTPSRGFCIELGAMFTVLIFSKLGVPVSTTHCITGATCGVGLCNGTVKALNWTMLLIIAVGWVLTCVFSGVATGLIFWGLATTPHATPGNGFVF